MCWNDERLSQKMVEKWPIYCPPPFGSLNGFLFNNQCTASWRTLEGRVSAENRGCDHSRELTCRECDKEGFHVTGPGVLFLWGHRELQQNMSRSEGGQSAFRCIFPPVNKAAHERNQYELTVLVKKRKKAALTGARRQCEWSSCGKWVTLTHFKHPNNERYLGSQGDEHSPHKSATFEEW